MIDEWDLWNKQIEERESRQNEIKKIVNAEIIKIVCGLAILYYLFKTLDSWLLVFILLILGYFIVDVFKYFMLGERLDQCEKIAVEITRLRCLAELRKQQSQVWKVVEDGNMKTIELIELEEFTKRFFETIGTNLRNLENESPYFRARLRKKVRNMSKQLFDEMMQFAKKEGATPCAWMNWKN